MAAFDNCDHEEVSLSGIGVSHDKFVCEHRKTSHNVQFFKIELYAFSESAIIYEYFAFYFVQLSLLEAEIFTF